MNEVYSGFDERLRADGAALWRLCFLLIRRPKDAEELAFQSLLRLAARRENEKGNDQLFLFSSACRLCEDWYIRKARKKPKAQELREAGLPFSIREELLTLMDASFQHRAAAALAASSFSAEDIRAVAGRRAAAIAERLTRDELDEAQRIIPPEGMLSSLSDRVYDRFAERSVRLENRLHAIHAGFERAAPFLALAVLALFAFAWWFCRPGRISTQI